MNLPVNTGDLRNWFQGPLGSYLSQQVKPHLDQLLPGLFGYHLVQSLAPGGRDLSGSSKILHRVLVGRDAHADGAALVADPEDLPIASDSVDVNLLVHVLEFSSRPHRVLREAGRTLIGEGHIVIVLLNPWSLWGLWKLFAGWRRRPPWNGRFYSVARIRDWLALLDFEVVGVERFGYAPPLARMANRVEWLEHLGAALWPALGAGAMVVARKRVLTLTPVKHQWQARRTLIAGGLAEPSTREMCP